VPSVEEGFPETDLDSQVDFYISEWLDIAMSIRDIFESRGLQIINPVDPTGGNHSDVRAIDELKDLIGTEELVKNAVALEATCIVGALRKNEGLKDDVPSPHLVFTGNPGTGKTTVARLIGKLFREVGLLEKGHVVEARRSDLIGKHVGETSHMTLAVIEKAMGGILFIDEAYTLNDTHRGWGLSYGQECVAVLLQEMENRHGRFAVIVAGYPAEMTLFIESNPGLKSRFDQIWNFRDLTNDELLSIVKLFIMKGDFVLSPGCDEVLLDYLKGMPRDKHFGNARDARKMFQQMQRNHAVRVKNLVLPSREDLMTIIREDIKFENRSKPQERFGYL
jgi:AAA+ superfamily predicted ATPase